MSDLVTKKAYELFVATFKKKAADRLRSSGRGVWTGKLIESITGEVVIDEGEYHFYLDMEEYGQYIDEGVNGTEISHGSRFSYSNKKPPIKAISPWAKSKGLNPWAVQQSVFKKGIKGVHFFEEVYDEELAKMVDYIAEAEADDLLNRFGED